MLATVADEEKYFGLPAKDDHSSSDHITALTDHLKQISYNGMDAMGETGEMDASNKTKLIELCTDAIQHVRKQISTGSVQNDRTVSKPCAFSTQDFPSSVTSLPTIGAAVHHVEQYMLRLDQKDSVVGFKKNNTYYQGHKTDTLRRQAQTMHALISMAFLRDEKKLPDINASILLVGRVPSTPTNFGTNHSETDTSKNVFSPYHVLRELFRFLSGGKVPTPRPTQGAKQHPVGNYGTPLGAHGRAGADHKRKLSKIDDPTVYPTNGDGVFNYGTPTEAHGRAGAEHKRTVPKTNPKIYPKIYYPTAYPTNGDGGFEQSSTFGRQTKKRRKSHERRGKSPKNDAPFRQKYQNRKKSHARLLSSNNTGYAGATRVAGNRFQARIHFGGKLRTLGTFDTPQEAALAYDRAVIKNRLPISKLNFPNDYKDRSYRISDLDEEEETMFWAALVQESDVPTEDAFYEHVSPHQEEESRRHMGGAHVHYDGGDGGHYGDHYGNMGNDDLYPPMEEDDDLYLPKNPTPRDYAWLGNRSLKNSSIHRKSAGGKKKKVKAPPKLCLGVSEPGLVGQEVELGSGYNVKRRFIGKRAMVLGASPISGGWFEVVVFKSDGTPMAQHRWRRKSLVSLAPGADKVCSQAMVDELLRQYRETGTVAVEKKKDKRRKEFRAIAKAKGTDPNISSTPFAFSAQVAQMIPNSKQRAMPVPGNNPRFAYRGLPFAASSSSSSPKLCEEMQFWQDLTNFHQRKGLQSEQNAKVANKIRKEKLPKLAHKPLNMYLLFKLVISIGGMQNATANEGTWANIFRLLPNYSPTETSASYRLKKVYEEYLWEYEQEYYSHLRPGLSAPSGRSSSSSGQNSSSDGGKFDWGQEKKNLKKRAAAAMLEYASSSSSSSSSAFPSSPSS